MTTAPVIGGVLGLAEVVGDADVVEETETDVGADELVVAVVVRVVLEDVLIGALAEVVLGLGTPSLDSREETRDSRESRRDR
ncbi:MAG: hypothetical protein IPI32_12255 [Austwickia sp.]|nr:hypothetical protein [Austwickia sp.]MBK8435005.1 hypothetical protein [Austwickia sp.]MBK9101439.1 hypothetical protein [Austwickia sp.]